MTGTALLGFVGDIHLGETTTKIDESVKNELSNASYLIANLETPFFTGEFNEKDKPIPLCSSLENISALKELSIDAVSLANNHFCDYGDLGVQESLKALSDNDIRTVGAGRDFNEANKPLVITLKGLKIAFISSGEESIDTVKAEGASAGCSIVNQDELVATIASLKNEVDHIVVSLHWGLTNYHYPKPLQMALGRSLIDSGASVVVGHHPHVVQGYEYYRGGVIAYSLGNFLFKKYRRKDGESWSFEQRKSHWALFVYQSVKGCCERG